MAAVPRDAAAIYALLTDDERAHVLRRRGGAQDPAVAAALPHYSEAIMTWLRELVVSAAEGHDIDLDDRSFQRSNRADHYRSDARSAAPTAQPVAAEHQPLGLTDTIAAASLAGRGWDPAWSFEGRWEDNVHHDLWHLLFLLRPVDPTVDPEEVASCEVEGTILFNVPDGTLDTCPATHHAKRLFERRAAAGYGTAVELVRGCYQSSTRRFHVLGVDTSDAGASKQLTPALGLDDYKLVISPSGDQLTGISRGHRGHWDNQLQAVCVCSLLIMARRQSLAWAMGAHARLSVDSVLNDLPVELVDRVLVKLYLSSKNTLDQMMQDHAGRRQRVAMAARAERVPAEGIPARSSRR